MSVEPYKLDNYQTNLWETTFKALNVKWPVEINNDLALWHHILNEKVMNDWEEEVDRKID